MDLKPSNPEAVRAVLRLLAEREPTSKEEFRILQSECVALARHIAATPGLGIDMPETVWHWLSDVDIRFREPGYRAMQNRELVAALSEWENDGAA